VVQIAMAKRIQAAYRGYREHKAFKQDLRNVILVQSLWRRHLAEQHTKLLRVRQKLQEKRQQVVLELYQTEESYVSHLDTVLSVYMKPLRALEKKAGVTLEKVQQIFGNIEEIAARHKIFLSELKSIIIIDNFSQESRLAPCLLKMV
jgi:hypothetical protein